MSSAGDALVIPPPSIWICIADAGRLSMPKNLEASAIFRQGIDDLSMIGSLLVHIPVADAVVEDSLAASGASFGILFVGPSVAGSLEGPFIGRILVKLPLAASLDLFTSLPVLVFGTCIFS